MPDEISRAVAIFETMESLRRIFKALQNYSHEVSSQYGITGPQLWVLKTVFKNGSLPLGELSQKMYLHPSTISGVVDRLEKKGYVSRDRDDEDRRVVMVQLTPKGKRLVKRAPNPVQGKMIYGLRQMRKEKLDFIHESVQTLVEIMEAQNLRVTFFFDQD
jgi:MarR family transcriptional regulator, organic hydroperoxide resistance regulator